MKNYALAFLVMLPVILNAQTRLIIRCDDIGMSHSVNMAAKELMESGLPFSASVMFNCPWYQEAVEMLKQHPEISVGVHLTLNSEWKNYRWGPVCGRREVSSLIDSCGYFFSSSTRFFANKPKLREVEKELTAQVERAVNSGLTIDYIDYHMGTAVSIPEYRKIVERLARKFRLGLSEYFAEKDIKSMYSVPLADKIDSLSARLSHLPKDETHLLVCHIGRDNDELQAMSQLNSGALAFMSRHRQAELRALLDRGIRATMTDCKLRLMTYRQLIEEMGLDYMRPPIQSGY